MAKTRVVDGTELILDYDSPRVSSEYYECALPLTFDQYNKCAFNCQYCFSAFQDEANSYVGKGRVEGRDDAKQNSKYRNPVHAVDPDRVRAFWEGGGGNSWQYTLIKNLVAKRTPVHWGGLCDPFDPFERRFRIGLELMEYWAALDWPVVFSTKGTLMHTAPWSDVLRGRNFRFQFSITTLDAAKGKVCDSGVATPQERLDALRAVVHDLGCVATLRLRPIIPGFVSPEECCELIAQAHRAGATGVSTEFFCLEARGSFNRPKYERMSVAAGFDLFEFYKRNSPHQSGYLRLNRALKETYFVPMAKTAKQLGMRFSVSDKEFKELGNVGGCCGIYWDDEPANGTRDGKHGAFHLNMGTVTYASIVAREKGEVRWSDIVPHLDSWVGDGRMNIPKPSREKRSAHREQTLTDLMRTHWNDPNDAKSPYRYTGGKLEPSGVDANGDVVYKYNRDGYDDLMTGANGPLVQLRKKGT